MKNKIIKDFALLDLKQRSKLIKGSIVPRPIAWISTLNENGSTNLAPFSYFNVVADNILSVSFLPGASHNKDTLRNILRNKEAVINTATLDLVDLMNESSLSYKPEESEAELLNITMGSSQRIKTPSIKDAKINLEVKLLQHIPIKDSKDTHKSDMVLLEVISASFDPEILDTVHNYIIIDKLEPISRLSGPYFGTTKQLDGIKRK